MPVRPSARTSMSGIAVLAMERNGGMATTSIPATEAWTLLRPSRNASLIISISTRQAKRI